MEASELDRIVERARASLFHIDVFYTESDDDRRRIKDLTEALNLLAALRSPTDVDRVWQALKDRCASDPEKAKRLVMVSRDDVAAALSSGESQ